MAQWIAAIGSTLVILGGIYVAIMGWGEKNGSTKEWRDRVEEHLERHDQWHSDHFAHSMDKDSHWTGREREDQSKRMDKQDAMLDKIDDKITSLTERMYGK